VPLTWEARFGRNPAKCQPGGQRKMVTAARFETERYRWEREGVRGAAGGVPPPFAQLLRWGHAAVEDVTMELPLPALLLPDDDVLALVENLATLP